MCQQVCALVVNLFSLLSQNAHDSKLISPVPQAKFFHEDMVTSSRSKGLRKFRLLAGLNDCKIEMRKTPFFWVRLPFCSVISITACILMCGVRDCSYMCHFLILLSGFPDRSFVAQMSFYVKQLGRGM